MSNTGNIPRSKHSPKSRRGGGLKRKAARRSPQKTPAPRCITAGAITVASAAQVVPDDKPQWRAGSRQLYFAGVLVKRLTQPAANLDLVLKTFELEGWCEHIDDPLPFKPEVDPRDRLHDTVRRLNDQRNPLLTFHLDGLGKGIYWERRQPG
jgi:hypothetical protein